MSTQLHLLPATLRQLSTKLILCLLVAGFAGSSAFAQRITFQLNPKIGVKWQETSRHTMSMQQGSQTMSVMMEMQYQVTAKKTAVGYTYTLLPSKVIVKQDGKVITPTSAALTKGVRIAYAYNSKQKKMTATGFDKLLTNIKKTCSAELAKKLQPMFNPATLKATAEQEWQERVGRYINTTSIIGATKKITEKLPSPLGMPIPSTRAIKFVELRKVNNHSCVFITEQTTIDEKVVRDLFIKVMGSIPQGAQKGEIPTVNKISVTGNGERLIDPTTMMIYGETRNYSLKMDFSTKTQKNMYVAYAQKNEYLYQY